MRKELREVVERLRGFSLHKLRTQTRGMDYETVGWVVLCDGKIVDLTSKGGYIAPSRGLALKLLSRVRPDAPEALPEGDFWFDGSEVDELIEEDIERLEGPAVLERRGLYYEVKGDAAIHTVFAQASRKARETGETVYFTLNDVVGYVIPGDSADVAAEDWLRRRRSEPA